MKICIVGTGASGWIVCHYLEKLPFVSEITIIGSPSIPTIGVGESTTYSFRNFLNHLFNDPSEYWKFLKDADAAFKYGVKYQGWSEKDFLHAFVGGKDNNLYGYLLGKKSKDISADALSMPLFEEIYNNLICTDSNVQNYSFHFDANKLIAAFENLAKKKSKIKHLKNTVVESIQENGQIKKIKLDDGEVIDADYFISCIGQTAFNQKVFFEEYDSLTDILLTDKAIFYPLEYKNKKQEMHPYTIAKPMKYGWRWITPTWSRIGTGYVFSSKHVSVDEAINEFINDIGDTSIKPFVTDFIPRKSKNPYKINSCTLGMASGFLEPLDAPGLNILISFLPCLEKLLLISINMSILIAVLIFQLTNIFEINCETL
jgi:tryptophan halogenase